MLVGPPPGSISGVWKIGNGHDEPRLPTIAVAVALISTLAKPTARPKIGLIVLYAVATIVSFATYVCLISMSVLLEHVPSLPTMPETAFLTVAYSHPFAIASVVSLGRCWTPANAAASTEF